MPTVMIVGPNFIGTCDSLAIGFVKAGWGSRVFTWGRPKSTPIRIAKEKLFTKGTMQEFLEGKFNRLLRNEVIPFAKSAQLDLIVFIKPQMVDSENLEELKRLGKPMVAWATDSMDRFPAQQSLHEICRKTYVMDGGDVKSSAEEWMPLGFDATIFQPSTGPKIFDILFVGNVFRKGYSTRRALFESLRKSAIGKRMRVGFVGASPVSFQNYIRWMPGNMRWISRGLPLPDLARVIARSRVCVNIHQDDGFQPVNPLFFAIAGCKVCQVVDSREYLQDWLRPEVDVVATAPADFIESLKELLANEGEIDRISQNGFEMAKKHTFFARARHIVDGICSST